MKRIGFVIASLFVFSLSSRAHDPGLSGAVGQLQSNQLQLTLSFAVRDAAHIVQLDANNDGQVTPEEFALGQNRLAEAVSAHCKVECDGALVKSEVVVCRQEDAKNVSVRLNFPVSGARELELEFPIIQRMPLGHRMFFSLSDSTGQTVIERLLAANATDVAVKLGSQAAAPPLKVGHPFTDFVLMGVAHIGTGYDHLLFLFALLVVTGTFRSALAVITAFTIAHSITLAVATFNLVKISPNTTEPLIAATIVYVGLENLWRQGKPHKRWLLTFSFGLVHGFGFASVLREMGVGGRAGGVAMPLLGFNLGVEIGQLAVAGIVLPMVWKLRTRENFLRYGVPACSVVVTLAGGFWFIQRVWFS